MDKKEIKKIQIQITNQNYEAYSTSYSEDYYIVDKMTKNSYVQANKLNFKYHNYFQYSFYYHQYLYIKFLF